MSKRYEACFCKTFRKIVPVEDVQQYYELHGGIDGYYGNMYCPECKKAELSFTHKTREKRAFFLGRKHLRTHLGARLILSMQVEKKLLNMYSVLGILRID